MGEKVSPMELEDSKKKSSGCSCCTCLVLFVVIAALAGGLIALGIVYANQKCEEPKIQSDLCLTQECVTACKCVVEYVLKARRKSIYTGCFLLCPVYDRASCLHF